MTELPVLSDECFSWMVEREKEYLPREDYLRRLRSGELDMSLRGEAFDWMFKACVHYGFGEVCLYSSMNYFDRFLSVYDLPAGKTWTAQLVAVACLLLAAKVDEVNVPNAVDLQCGLINQPGEPRFLFEAKTVQRMEMILLNTFKWNLKPYTPLNFVEYFLSKLNRNKIPQQPWISRSIQILASILKGIDFLEFRPSEIAAAVAIYISGETQVAMDDFPDKASAAAAAALPCFIEVKKGKVIKCLELIQHLMVSSISGSGSGSLSWSSPNGVLEAASLSYTPSSSFPSAKRRKLNEGQFTVSEEEEKNH